MNINPKLFVELENIAKEQFSQINFVKWNSYGMKITQEVFNILQSFVPIKNPKGQNKAFQLKENGENTGIFHEIPEQIGNVMES